MQLLGRIIDANGLSTEATIDVVVKTPSTGQSETPPYLQLLLGPLIDINTSVPNWPSCYNVRLEEAIQRMISIVAAGTYDYVPGSNNVDNPHYGPLRMVVMRNIRKGILFT